VFEIIEAHKRVSINRLKVAVNDNEVRAYTGLRRHNDDVVLHKITDIIRGICYPLSATHTI
jgi:hypothetical protein